MMKSSKTIQNTFNAKGHAGNLAKRLASLSAAFLVTGCTTTLNIPEEAVAVSEYSSGLMQSANPIRQAEGHLTFLHYAVKNGGEKYGPYFETSPELMVIWNDYKNLDKPNQKRVKDILESVDFVRPATRLKAMEDLAKILPAFQNPMTNAPDPSSGGKDPGKNSEGQNPGTERVSVSRQNGHLIFDLKQ